MGHFLFSKLLNGTLTLLGVASLVFLIFSVLPGDPAQMMLDQNEGSEQLEALKKKYGFDLPVYQQYLYYLNDISPISIHSREPHPFTHFSSEKHSGIQLFKTDKWQTAVKWP